MQEARQIVYFFQAQDPECQIKREVARSSTLEGKRDLWARLEVQLVEASVEVAKRFDELALAKRALDRAHELASRRRLECDRIRMEIKAMENSSQDGSTKQDINQ